MHLGASRYWRTSRSVPHSTLSRVTVVTVKDAATGLVDRNVGIYESGDLERRTPNGGFATDV